MDRATLDREKRPVRQSSFYQRIDIRGCNKDLPAPLIDKIEKKCLSLLVKFTGQIIKKQDRSFSRPFFQFHNLRYFKS